MDLPYLIAECSPDIAPQTMYSLVMVESGGNPYAIALVDKSDKIDLSKQPQNQKTAENLINEIEKLNLNYSVGIGQINSSNFTSYNIKSGKELLNPCLNLKISQSILEKCYKKFETVKKALSCYYSGNEKRGFVRDFNNSSYVERVLKKRYVVPDILQSKNEVANNDAVNLKVANYGAVNSTDKQNIKDTPKNFAYSSDVFIKNRKNNSSDKIVFK